jgi:hypothetical protein
MPKALRPVAREGADRTRELEADWEGASALKHNRWPHCQQDRLHTTVEPFELAEALHRNAAVYIGPKRGRLLTLDGVEPFLAERLRSQNERGRLLLIGTYVVCVHWLEFVGRRYGLNHQYPLPQLRCFVEQCFGLEHVGISMGVLSDALRSCLFQIKYKKLRGGGGSEWMTNIRSVAKVGFDKNCQPMHGPITKIGERGALPPIAIKHFARDPS